MNYDDVSTCDDPPPPPCLTAYWVAGVILVVAAIIIFGVIPPTSLDRLVLADNTTQLLVDANWTDVFYDETLIASPRWAHPEAPVGPNAEVTSLVAGTYTLYIAIHPTIFPTEMVSPFDNGPCGEPCPCENDPCDNSSECCSPSQGWLMGNASVCAGEACQTCRFLGELCDFSEQCSCEGLQNLTCGNFTGQGPLCFPLEPDGPCGYCPCFDVPCNTTSDCCDPSEHGLPQASYCSSNSSQCRQCKDTFDTCLIDEDCRCNGTLNHCLQDIFECVPCAAPGEGCDDNSDCVCYDLATKCFDGVCAVACVEGGPGCPCANVSCIVDSECCDPAIYSIPNASYCNQDSLTCVQCAAPNEPCVADADCQCNGTSFVCTAGICTPPCGTCPCVNVACSSDSDCCSPSIYGVGNASYCPGGDGGGICFACVGIGGICETNADCRCFNPAANCSGVICVQAPTAAPTQAPTKAPTPAPTKTPTQAPTQAPTKAPTAVPTNAPTQAPTATPTNAPTQVPTNVPTQAPTPSPTNTPTKAPTQSPTNAPTQSPTNAPTKAPTQSPTNAPTQVPSQSPTSAPTRAPTVSPTPAPTQAPTTAAPTVEPICPPVPTIYARLMRQRAPNPAFVPVGSPFTPILSGVMQLVVVTNLDTEVGDILKVQWTSTDCPTMALTPVPFDLGLIGVSNMGIQPISAYFVADNV